MTPSKGRILAFILEMMGLACVLCTAFYVTDPMLEKVGYVVGAIVAIGGVVVDHIFYRCPHCGRYLYRNQGKHCQYCGKSIDE